MTAEASVDGGQSGWLTGWLDSRRRDIEAALQARLPARSAVDDPGRLIEAMRYSLLAPGKRLRPLLALAAAEAIAGPPATDAEPDELLVLAAVSVEAVHCYSLIHDDLPAMDDDDLRRGKPSNHKVFGEATAILAGDALLTLAFEWLATAGEASGRPQHFGRATLALARGAGMGGMVRGQARDLGEPPPRGLVALETLHTEKTAGLFRAAVEVGAAAAGATGPQLEALGLFGVCFGVAFQHTDDREDGDHGDHAAEARARVPELLATAVQALDALPAGADRVPRGGRVLRALAAQLGEKFLTKLPERTATPTESPSRDR